MKPLRFPAAHVPHEKPSVDAEPISRREQVYSAFSGDGCRRLVR